MPEGAREADVTTKGKGKPMSADEVAKVARRIAVMRDAYQSRPDAAEVFAALNLADAGLALASCADVSVPAMRECVRGEARHFVATVDDVLGGGDPKPRERAEAGALMGEVG